MQPASWFYTQVYERWFKALVPAYMGDINCVLEFDRHVDEHRLTQAFLAALALEPMWSYRFVAHWWIPYWQIIPRGERPSLIKVEHCADAGARHAAWERILETPVDAAVQVHLLRTPENDQAIFRFDHCLADGHAARVFIESVAECLGRAAAPPENDAPVIRRTLKLLHSTLNRRGRLKLLGETVQSVRRTAAGAGSPLPKATGGDPYASPQFLHYPAGAAEQLAVRAMRDRATAAMVVLAATYVALCELVPSCKDSVWPIQVPVNLRRYLPAGQQSAPASQLIGRAAVSVDPHHAADLPAVLEQIRLQFHQQRGPKFGLANSPLILELPILSHFLFFSPFFLTSRNLRRTRVENSKLPLVLCSDLGQIGRPGDDWAGAAITQGYSTQGTFRFPSVMIGMSTCGTRMSLSIGSGPGAFVQQLAERIDFHLSNYAGWAPLIAQPGLQGAPA